MRTTGSIGSAFALGGLVTATGKEPRRKSPVYGHLWIYASEFPPNWDCTPILDRVFRDFKYAGIEGVEVMESLLRNPDILSIGADLIQQHNLPIIGSSYYADFWRRDDRERILEDVEFVTHRLRQLGGTIFGITVGDAKRAKTEEELDAQADTLQAAMRICSKHQVQPNLHNHVFEVADDLHDLKGTLDRVPHVKLGPDLSWLAKAGVDPVRFIEQYGDRIVYLHIRDNTADGLFAEAVGDGTIDFPAIAAALKKVDFQGPVAIELAYDQAPERETKDNWKRSRNHVREVFGW